MSVYTHTLIYFRPILLMHIVGYLTFDSLETTTTTTNERRTTKSDGKCCTQ